MSMERALRLGSGRRLFAWTVLGLLSVGIFWPPLGYWTSPIVCAWFVGAQKPLAGLARLAAIQISVAAVTGLFGGAPAHWDGLAGRLLALGMGLVPMFAYRLLSPRVRPGLAGLALPLFSVISTWGLGRLVPAASLAMAVETPKAPHLLAQALSAGAGLEGLYLSHAVAGLALWGWIGDWRGGFAKAAPFAAPLLLAPILAQRFAPGALASLPFPPLAMTCLALAAGLAAFALLARPFDPLLAPLETDLALLRAPGGGARLALTDGGLTAGDNRLFPIRRGLARFVEAADLGGGNGRLAGLYRNIAGFYDDTQRIYSALLGLDRQAYVRAYLKDLDLHGGDRVLETSIGTGLSFKVLPHDIEVFGVDLSAQMLEVCRENFSRWGRTARLYLANAEALPFADETFDCVFHVGGINFFDDKAAAIAEMIRVARPGARILIADETEKHVKAVYEATPGTRDYFRNREGPVAAPLALIPPEMGEVSFRTLMNDQFYVISFVKPPAVAESR